LPKTEKEKARRLQEQIANEERYHAANRRSTARMASEVARKEEIVWLPGGTHNVGYGETPGMEDKPFRLLSDGVDGRVIYWLVECPPTMMFPGDYQFVTNPDGSLIDAPEPAQRAVWNPQD
jgi:hypothetical protein